MICLLIGACIQSERVEARKDIPRAVRDCENPPRYEMANRDEPLLASHPHEEEEVHIAIAGADISGAGQAGQDGRGIESNAGNGEAGGSTSGAGGGEAGRQ